MSVKQPEPGVSHTKQTLSDLTLALFRRPVPGRFFRELSVKQFEWRNYSIRLAIIGSSHVLTFSSGSDAMQEILACVETATLPETPVSEWDPEAVSVEKSVSRYSYTCSTSVQPLDREERNKRETLREDDHAAVFTFPSENGSLPYTSLKWTTGNRELTIYSRHSYPQEQRVLTSKTILRT